MAKQEQETTRPGLTTRMLATVERVGNKLPDPAVLFIALLFIVWVLSWLLSYVTFGVIDPRSNEPLVINNLLAPRAFTEFLSVMVTNFSHFHPVGVVLVAMLGIGVAEHTGFINSAIRSLLNVTPMKLLTPMVILVGIVSHSAVDAGYVLVIPLGGVIFYAPGVTRLPVSPPRSPAYRAASPPTSCRVHSTRCCRDSRRREHRSSTRTLSSIR
jgi:aminobenzoyl-glutamate transport protein